MIKHRWGLLPLLGLLATTAVACSDVEPTMPQMETDAAQFHHKAGHADKGTTPGWFNGRTVTFFYNKDFFCDPTSPSAADSGCTLGVEPQTAPRGGDVPVLYVMVPLFSPAPANLQCPEAGECINHPATMDLSRVLGPGTGNAALPPHSHIVDVQRGGWWEIEVVGVTDPATWAQVEAGKDLATVRRLQAAGAGITPDIPSNLFLFFNVRP